MPSKRNKRYCFWLVSLLIWLCLPLWAQTSKPDLYLNQRVSFVNYSLEQGLSNKTVGTIHQDKEGFIWVGTQDGLNRFDGYKFTTYRTDSTGVSYTFITYIHEDGQGNLWIATFNKGLFRFDKRSEKFTNYLITTPGQNNRNVCLNIFEDKQGKLWIPSRGGLNKFDPQTGRFTLYPSPCPGFNMYDLYQDKAGIFWLATFLGLFQFDPHTGKFSLFPLGEADELKAPSVHAILPDRSGTLWIGSNRGLFQINPLNNQITHYPFNKNGLTGYRIYKEEIVEDAAGMIWVGTNEGLWQLNPATGQFTSYRSNTPVQGGLKNYEIWTLYLDSSGLLWIGTTQGLLRLEKVSKPFHTYQFRPDASSSYYKENSIGFLYEDHAGTLWLSNDSLGGLYNYDWEKQKLTHYPANPADAHSLVDNYVPTVLEDHNGVMWVLSGNFLHALNRQTGKFTRYPTPFHCWLLAEDPTGQLWVGGEALAHFDRESSAFTSYRHNTADSNSMAKNHLNHLFISRKGTIWMGISTIGLSKLEPQTGRFTHYQPNFINPAGQLNDRNVANIYEDEAGVLWIATIFGGLNRLDPNTGVFTAYTAQDGLPSNYIASILGDTSGHLWLGTSNGISRFDPVTHTFRNYDHKDGLQDDVFYSSGNAKNVSGQLLFGGPNGFNVFYPDSIRDNPLIPPVHITSFKVLDKARPVERSGIKLSYDENFLSFEFTALNYIKPEKNQYAYQLEGVDKDWVYSGNRRFVNYTDLDPGSYTFRVKASNNDGIWNQQGTSLHFVISPPWWKTWWFISFSILVTLGLLYGGFRYRLTQVRKQEQEKANFNKKVSQLEMQALRAQMNPHFIFNSLNSINRFILKNNPEAASDYLSKFSRLIRLILQNSNTPTITLENELEALNLYLEMEALRFKGKFTFSITCGKEVEVDFIEIPPLIIQPYVENAIWHGLMHKEAMGHIHIRIEQQQEMLTCTIEDDGIGRVRAAQLKSKSATKSKSLGMQITAHRLELMHTLNGKQTRVEVVDLVDASAQACGTKVILSLPIGLSMG